MKSLPRLNQAPYVAAMPTETVYGLAARIDCPEGIEAIFKIKRRPFFDPLIVHVSSVKQAKTLVSSWSPMAEILASHFWPGPLTLVLPKGQIINPMITSGLETVGIRMPNHPLALALIQQEGVPLAAPSANLFGRTSPTSADHVRSEFPDLATVIDGGECEVGLESTVLHIDQLKLSILRPGAVTQSQIEEVLKKHGAHFEFVPSIAKNQAPGQLKHHYMPSVPLILVEDSKLKGSELIQRIRDRIEELPDMVEGVKIIKPTKYENIVELHLPENPVLASRILYAQLRDLTASNPDLILFRPPSIFLSESWQALSDRLTKAASLTI
jgi:L-threonylcarbamoyladenylate synthase